MQGATGTDAVDGDITARVDACVPGYRFARYGLQACNVSTATPRNITITHSVAGAYGKRAAVTRTVVVLPRCVLGEVPCSTGGCSVGGVCLGGTRASAAARSNSAPRLALKPPGTTDATVFVPAGTEYRRCTAEDLSLRRVCEAGVSAGDAEDGDLTQRVLACPPAACLPFGCPGHEFAVKGAFGN